MTHNVFEECEECGEPCAEGAKRCPWSGMFLCGDCAYDEGVAAEDRYLDERYDEDTQQASTDK